MSRNGIGRAQFGQMNQEGSPWHNKDIYNIAVALDSALSAQHSATQNTDNRSGHSYSALYEGNGNAAQQIQHFFANDSPLYVGNLKNLKKVIEGHSYFTDKGDSTIVSVRSRLKDTAAKYDVPFWQSEYSMLADGYKEGKRAKSPRLTAPCF